MKFLDAVRIGIQKGLRIRKKGELFWVNSSWFKDTLDEDWEVDEKKVVVTEAIIDTALYHADLHTSKVPDEPGYLQEFIKQLKKELGL